MSRPVVADLDGDGRPEVIIGTFVDQTQTAVRGELIVLDGSGNVRRPLHVEHADQSLGLVRIGEVGIREHHEDLEDHAEVGADSIFGFIDRHSIWKRKHHDI